MSGIIEALDAFRGVELSDAPDARLEEDFAELQRASELLGLERSRRLAEIERRGTYQRDGHLSAAAWLVTAFRLSWGVARRLVKTSRALGAMPSTAAAVETGDVSMCAAEVLTTARDADRERFAKAEPMLLEAARIHSVPDLQRVVAYWRQACERETPLSDNDPLFKRRRLHVSPTIFGMVRVDGDLDPETGELFLTALRSVDDAWTHSVPAHSIEPRHSACMTRSGTSARSISTSRTGRLLVANVPI
jgi:hypothetical protein